jgi:hypothetical protein
MLDTAGKNQMIQQLQLVNSELQRQLTLTISLLNEKSIVAESQARRLTALQMSSTASATSASLSDPLQFTPGMGFNPGAGSLLQAGGVPTSYGLDTVLASPLHGLNTAATVLASPLHGLNTAAPAFEASNTMSALSPLRSDAASFDASTALFGHGALHCPNMATTLAWQLP